LFGNSLNSSAVYCFLEYFNVHHQQKTALCYHYQQQ